MVRAPQFSSAWLSRASPGEPTQHCLPRLPWICSFSPACPRSDRPGQPSPGRSPPRWTFHRTWVSLAPSTQLSSGHVAQERPAQPRVPRLRKPVLLKACVAHPALSSKLPPGLTQPSFPQPTGSCKISPAWPDSVHAGQHSSVEPRETCWPSGARGGQTPSTELLPLQRHWARPSSQASLSMLPHATCSHT